MILNPYRNRAWVFWGFAALVVLSACHPKKGRVSQSPPPLPRIETLVVMGFMPALSAWDQPKMVRSPISGAVFLAEPVSEEAARKMTNTLFERLVQEGRYRLVSPGQALGVYSSLVSSGPVQEEMEILQQIGRAFSADAVLIGHLYRFREREGTDYAVNRAASVAFDLHIIGLEDRAILWRGRFDKTQQSLSQNILDMNTFLKGQGRWMTAERLAEMGLDNLLAQLLQHPGVK